MKALALYSGGLDSTIAINLVKKQGIEVIALNFISHFFGGENESIKNLAAQLGIEVVFVDFKDAQREIVENPPSGYGKNMNPCIDCHALMLKYAKQLLPKLGASFIITGEVLGQRPMSQNLSSLKRVEKLAEVKGLLVRPLSAKILAKTLPEENGWIDRDKLLDIQGRSRKRQIEYATVNNIEDFPSPGGGCLLTDPNFSKKLRILKEDENFSNKIFFDLLKIGRFLRISSDCYIFVGRNEEENLKIEKFKKHGVFIEAHKTPGPSILIIGNYNEEIISFSKKMFSMYSKVKGEEKVYIKVESKDETIEKINLKKIQEDVEKYIIK